MELVFHYHCALDLNNWDFHCRRLVLKYCSLLDCWRHCCRRRHETIEDDRDCEDGAGVPLRATDIGSRVDDSKDGDIVDRVDGKVVVASSRRKDAVVWVLGEHSVPVDHREDIVVRMVDSGESWVRREVLRARLKRK